jgi:hypothetical protein
VQYEYFSTLLILSLMVRLIKRFNSSVDSGKKKYVCSNHGRLTEAHREDIKISVSAIQVNR